MRLGLLVLPLALGCSSAETFATPAPDTGAQDATSSGETETDSGAAEVATDATSEAADAGPTPESLCKGGAPRLEWKDGRCLDHAFATDAGVPSPCTFLLADDGPWRCMPEPHGKVVGALDTDCMSVNGPRLLDASPPIADGVIGASIQRSDGRWEAHRAEFWGSGGLWRRLVAGTSVCETKPTFETFPYTNSSGMIVRVYNPPLPPTQFYAASGT